VVWTIARRELTDQLTSLRFLIIALLVVGLTPLVVYVGARDYSTRLGDYSRLAAEKQKLVGEGKTLWVRGAVNVPALRAIREPEPLSALVRGLDAALPEYWDFTPGGVQEGPLAVRPRRMLDILGQLDLEFLVRVVLGLLAILMAFDAVAGEKELGTLRAVLSQSVSRPAFLSGKLLGGAVTLSVPLAAIFPLALLSAQVFGLDIARGDRLAKTLLIAAGSAAYLLCVYALGLLVSALSASQKTALVVLLVAWVLAALAMPPLAALIAQVVEPAPPPQAIESRKQALNRQLKRELDLAMGSVALELAGKSADSLDSLNQEMILSRRREIDARARPLQEAYAARRRRLLAEVDREAERKAGAQNRVARTIMALSPAAAFAGSVTDLAGTGDARREAWLAAVGLQQSRLDRYFEDPAIMSFAVEGKNRSGTFSTSWREEPRLSDLPPFSPPRRDARAAVADALPALGLLALYAGIFIVGGFLAFSRYDVR